MRHPQLHALFLVGLLLTFSMLTAVSLHTYYEWGLVGYSVVSHDAAEQKEDQRDALILYFLGGMVLILLSLYSLLLWRHYL